jgi:tRNA(Arg) A34 adenosine deaminase TadA
MRSGAVIMAHIGEAIYGFSDPRRGCLGGAILPLALAKSNHHPAMKADILRDKCYVPMRHFFRN